ncbi:transcriptional regulator [Micromonospora sp. NPDC005652]|uniref:transcriptional regulator n=1 Tax=Micromonospora sp. NPDC005652 TaxID=3157046 RepID=UPI00340528A0
MKRTRPTVNPGVVGALFAAVLPAHEVADHILQRHSDAKLKGERGPVGRRACTNHVASYTLVQVAAAYGVARASGVRLRPGSVLAGAAVSALTHWVVDRREPLRRVAHALGKGEFHDMGKPRDGHDDNPCLGTGALAMDQAWHKGWLLATVLLMARGARVVRR